MPEINVNAILQRRSRILMDLPRLKLTRQSTENKRAKDIDKKTEISFEKIFLKEVTIDAVKKKVKSDVSP